MVSRRRFLGAAAAGALGWAGPSLGADPPFILIDPMLLAGARRLAGTPMGAYALRSAERGLMRAPHAVPVVHTEGTLPGQGIYDLSLEAKRDWPAALDVALGGALTGDERFVQKAVEFWAAWLTTYRVSLNPIDETDLDQMLLAYDLLPMAARAPIADQVAGFCRTTATGYLDAMPRVRGGTATNNWQSHRVKLATLTAFAMGDSGLVARARAAFRKQLADNLREDGTVLDFVERDALHYVTYDLEPLLVAALAARAHGEDWYGDGDRALGRAIAWLVPYATGEKVHEEYVRSTVAFDRQRAAAGMPGFAGMWMSDGAEYTFALATRLDAQFKDVSEKLTPGFGGTRRPKAPWLHLTMPV